MILIDEATVEATIYRDIPNKAGGIVYLAKVSFPDVGFYISGITAQISPKHPESGWWVQMPRSKAGKGWVRPLEVNKSSEFFELIQTRVIEAVDQYIQLVQLSGGIGDDINLESLPTE